MDKLISAIFSGIIGMVGGIFEVFSGLVQELLHPKQKTDYTASFIPAGELCSVHNHGFCITGKKSLTISQSYSNASVYGPSGSGKSTSVSIPSVFSIAKGGSSICINDPSGEIYAACSGYLASLGYTIYRIDFSDPFSASYNCLARCKTVSDILKVVSLILKNALGDSKADPFWERSAAMLIALFARYLLFHAAPEYRTMANVLRLIEAFAVHPEKTDRLFAATRDEELLSAYKAILVTGDKTLQSIIATARAALAIFSDPAVVRTTTGDSIDFSLLRTERTAIFVCNPVQDAEYFKPLSALFFQSLFNETMSRIPQMTANSIFFILDEAATIRFTSLSTTISNIRKYRAGIMLLTQDFQSLLALYGSAEAHNIRTNTFAQVYLKGQPLETCRELETILGRFSHSDGHTERTRQLMTVDEIRMSDDAIILCGNHAPMKVRMTQFFQRDSLRKYAQMPPYQPEPNPFAHIIPPLIPLL